MNETEGNTWKSLEEEMRYRFIGRASAYTDPNDLYKPILEMMRKAYRLGLFEKKTDLLLSHPNEGVSDVV